jgi:putative glutamine amidotransferase
MSRWLITQRLERNRHGDVVDSLERSYLAYFGKLFPSIAVVSNYGFVPDPSDYQGLLLSGGGDLPNRLMGGQLSPPEDELAEEKYEIQSNWLANALARRKQVIAICYGMHLVNAFLGGRVIHDVHQGALERRPGQPHEVMLSHQCSLDWPSQSVMVNGYHNHGVTSKTLSPDLAPVAIDMPYDVVEAARHVSLPVLALQWHPERASPQPEINRLLIERFLAGEL